MTTKRDAQRRLSRSLLGVLLLCTLSACDDDEDAYGEVGFAALNAEVQVPADNPITVEKVRLGKLLFFDPILSVEGEIACGTCHHPDFAYGDGLALAIGVGGEGIGPDRIPGSEFPHVGRNAPSLVNVAFNGLQGMGSSPGPKQAPMFWDHRIRGLEAQVLEPIRSASEMRGSGILQEEAIQEALQRLEAIEEYVDLFESVFGPGGITEVRLSQALATYVRSLVVRNSPLDRFLRGDQEALTQQQRAGMEVFERANCINCHNGPMLSDWSLKRLGVGPHPERSQEDPGAGSFRFRSASLRNVELTAPYMHNGTIATLEEVVDFYSAGISVHPSIPDNEIEPQPMTAEEKLALVAFLEAMTDTDFNRDVPDSVPSGLPVPGSPRP